VEIETSSLIGSLTVASVQEWHTIPETGVVRSLERLQVELSRPTSPVLSTSVDGQCDELVAVAGHQFITLIVDIMLGVRHRVERACQR